MALGMAIACARGIVEGHQAMQTGVETYLHAGNAGTFNLYGKQVGMIGYGGLARNLHPLLKPFGCRVAVYDAWLGERYLRRQGVEPLPLDELMATSQVIFVLAVPSDENRALLDRTQLERIRPDAALILVSRAHLVDFDALTELLHEGRFRAAIDVFPQEPLDPAHPIRKRAECCALRAPGRQRQGGPLGDRRNGVGRSGSHRQRHAATADAASRAGTGAQVCQHAR